MQGLEKNSNNDYICTAYKVSIYVPSYFFDKGLAEERGTTTVTFGILYIEVFAKEGSTPAVYSTHIPAELNIQYSESSKTRRRFNNSKEDEEYLVFTSYNGEVVIKNAIQVESAGGFATFLKFMLFGKLPEDIKYSDLPALLIKSAESNGVNPGVTNFIFELMMTELARDKKDNSIPYRFTASKTGNELGYETVRLNDVPSLSSVFAGISFENIDLALTRSVVNSRAGHKNAIPPTEELLYY